MKKLLLLAVVVLVSVSLLPVRNSSKPNFANPLFESLWTARSAAADSVDLWGSEPLLWRIEPYADAPDGRRVVQYFDRGRMEMTPTNFGGADLTQGLLALEMTTGEIRLGAKLLEYKAPADIAIDSGPDDPSVPTYAGLAHVVENPAPDRSAQPEPINSWIDATGNVTQANPPASALTATYVAETGHNLPDVFATLFAQHSFGDVSWIEALGYPISEPYWTMYRRDGQTLPSLIQVFERRILVYTPSLSADQRVTLANVGRHYYRWRYGQEVPRVLPTPMAGDTSPLLAVTVPDGYQVGVYAQHLGTPVGLAIGPSGNLWIATAQGDIVEVRSTTSGGAAGQTTVFAKGLPNPHGIAVSSDAAYVSVDDGIMRLRDTNGDGIADQQSYVSRTIEPAPGPQGAPALGPAGNIYLAGRLLPDGNSRVVAVTSGSGATTEVAKPLAKPGPVEVARDKLYVIEQRADGTSFLYSMALRADGSLGTPTAPLAEFSSGQVVNKVLVLDSTLWPDSPSGTILAALTDGTRGKIVRLLPKSDGTLPDVVDFSTNFGLSDDLVVGLDGSLYVADATNQQVIKIVTRHHPSP